MNKLMPTPTDCKQCGEPYYGPPGVKCNDCERAALDPSDATDCSGVLLAAEHMDWQQVVLNGGPPCFAIVENDSGHFCGRAQRWEGHDSHHTFVSLADLLRNLPNSVLSQPKP